MSALDPRTLRRVVAVLCVTEVTSWGVIYYAFPLLAPQISRTHGWSMAAVTGAFSLSLVTAALCGIAAGRAIDRFGPRPVMTAGSILAPPAVLAVASAPSYPWFLLAWTVVGVAASAVLYPPAFAALTRWGGAQRVKALTALTIAGGLSSTVFGPVTAALEGWLGWQGAYVVLAGALAVITVPAHWFGLRAPWETSIPSPMPAPNPAPAAPVWRTGPFLVLLVAMCSGAVCVYAVVVNLVPLLLERGLTTFEAALGLGLGGIGQVLSRLGYARFAARTSPVARSAAIFVGVATTTALFAILPGPVLLLLALSVLSGGTRGVYTLLQATVVSDRWGTLNFGHLNGIMLAPVTLATASGPWLGSVLAEVLGSYAACFLVLSGFAALAALLTPWTIPGGQAGRTAVNSSRT